MTAELYFLTELISTILYDKPFPEVPSSIDWEAFSRLVLKNGFYPLVYDELKHCSEVPKQVLNQFAAFCDVALVQSATQDYYAEQILERFEQEGIRSLPLKGLILRHLYPKSTMRMMTDMDILIGTEKLERSREVMKKLGFGVYRYDEHHDIYHIPPDINVELHKLLIVGEMENYFQIGFERAHMKENCSYTYELSLEDFYIHMIGHMAYHFAHGGVGVRLVLDIQVYLDKYGKDMNREYIDEELKKAGLYTFTKHVEKLASIWFLGEESDDFYEELGQYIVDSGYLGARKHSEILEVVKHAGSGDESTAKGKAIFILIFPPLKTMTFLYPILKRQPWLLPFTWIARICQVIFKRREDISRMTRLSRVEDDEIQRLGKLYDKLEMRPFL